MGAEILAKISGKAIHYGGVCGGIPDVSMEELMGALAGLDRGPELLIRAAVCGQDTSEIIRELCLEASMAAFSLAATKKWRADKGRPVFQIMARLAVEEIVYPNSYFCPACGGSGKTRQWVKNPSGVCNVCKGQGTRAFSNRKAAKLTGLAETTWRNTWKPRYHDIRMLILSWYSSGISHVRKQLASDER